MKYNAFLLAQACGLILNEFEGGFKTGHREFRALSSEANNTHKENNFQRIKHPRNVMERM